MARPLKQGLDYFPLDTDFLSDSKVRKIIMLVAQIPSLY